MKLTIRKKLIVAIVLLAVFIFLFGLFLLRQSEALLTKSIGETSLFLAQERMLEIDKSIHRNIEEVERYSQDLFVVDYVERSNAQLELLKDAREIIRQQDAEWKAAGKEEVTPFMTQLLNSELSRAVYQKFITFFSKTYGYNIFSEVIVTNRFGTVVAITGKTSDFDQSDEEWWQMSRDQGSTVGEVEYDESSQKFIIPVSVPIKDQRGEFIGSIKGLIDVIELIREGEVTTKYRQDADVRVILPSGSLIYANFTFKSFEDLKDTELFQKAQGIEGFFAAKDRGKEKIFSFVQSQGYGKYLGFKWILLVGYDKDDILEPISVLRKSFLLEAGIIIVLGMAFVFLFTRSFTGSIIELQAVAQELQKGNFKARASRVPQDEIGEFAQVFNTMANQLEQTYLIMEKKVQERTQDLDKTKQELEVAKTDLEKKVQERTGELKKLKDDLEQTVSERTKNLQEKLGEVERLNKMMIDRELKMIQLKEENDKLRAGAAQDPNKTP